MDFDDLDFAALDEAVAQYTQAKEAALSNQVPNDSNLAIKTFDITEQLQIAHETGLQGHGVALAGSHQGQQEALQRQWAPPPAQHALPPGCAVAREAFQGGWLPRTSVSYHSQWQAHQPATERQHPGALDAAKDTGSHHPILRAARRPSIYAQQGAAGPLSPGGAAEPENDGFEGPSRELNTGGDELLAAACLNDGILVSG
jgi:hypothetical protein